MEMTTYVGYAVVASLVITLIIYGIGRWSGRWGANAAAVASSIIGLIAIWFFVFGDAQTAKDLGDVANNGSLLLDKIGASLGWVGASAVMARLLP